MKYRIFSSPDQEFDAFNHVHFFLTIFSRSVVIAVKYAGFSQENLSLINNQLITVELRNFTLLVQVMTDMGPESLEKNISKTMADLNIQEVSFYLRI